MPHQETDRERAERQARLSKAMGAMFLQDKVQKLERDVQQMTYSREIRRTQSSGNSSNRGAPTSSSARLGALRGMSRSATGPGFGTSSAGRDGQMTSVSEHVDHVRLIDASVLIYSLRTVHGWLNNPRFRMIVPSEAINTLDLLKKGNSIVNVAARTATRFLEERMQVDSSGDSSSGSDTFRWKAPGLFSQKDYERLDLSALQTLRSQILVNEQGEKADSKRMDSESEEYEISDQPSQCPELEDEPNGSMAPELAPVHTREILRAAAYLARAIADSKKPGLDTAVAVAYPPNTNKEASAGGSAASTDSSQVAAYEDRADGRIAELSLRALGLAVQVVGTAKSWSSEKQDGSSRSLAPPRETQRGKSKQPTEGPIILKRPLSKQDGPPISLMKRPDSSLSSASAAEPSNYGSISIIKSRHAAHQNRSQDSFQRFGTGSSSPRLSSKEGTRVPQMTILARPSSSSLMSSGIFDGTTSDNGEGSGGSVGLSGRPLGAKRLGMSAAERMEAYVKNLEK